jgi:hypothetical protein
LDWEASLRISASSAVGSLEPSATAKTRSASFSASCDRCTPSFSTKSSVLWIPAVSMSRSSTPPQRTDSSTVSPGGAGNVGDDGALITRQGVEQGGFPHVGTARDGGADAGFENFASLAGGKQAAQCGFRLQERIRHGRGVNVLNILVRVVHHGVKPGGNVQQRRLYLLQLAAQRAVELPGGVAGGIGGFPRQ